MGTYFQIVDLERNNELEDFPVRESRNRFNAPSRPAPVLHQALLLEFFFLPRVFIHKDKLLQVGSHPGRLGRR